MKTLLLAATLLAATGGVAASATYAQQQQLARQQLADRNFVAAQQLGEALLKLAQTPDEKVEALTLLGLTFSRQKLYSRAVETWQDALTYQGVLPINREVARRLLADTYREMGQWENARREYEKMLANPSQNNGNRKNTLDDLARVYLEAGDFDKSREIYRRIIQTPGLDESSIDSAYEKIASTYQSQGNEQQEKLTYQELLLRPNVSPYGVMFAYKNLGDLFRKAGQPVEAAQQYQQARTILLEKAQKQKEAKNWEGVVDALSPLTFSNLPPLEIVDLYQQLGDAFVQMDDLSAARQRFERGLEIANENNVASESKTLETAQQRFLLSIAQTYDDEKNEVQTRATLDKLLARPNVDFNFRQQAEQILQSLPPKP